MNIKAERAEEIAKNTCLAKIENNKMHVLRQFKDKVTNVVYKKGDVLEIVKKKEEK